MRTFDCWIQDYGHTREDGMMGVSAYDAASAAREYLERRFADLDYPVEVEVSVSETGKDNVSNFVVTVESVPQFHATEAPQHKYQPNGERTLCGISTVPPTSSSKRPCWDCHAAYMAQHPSVEMVEDAANPGREPTP